jgi:hypothetical protein
VYLILRAFTAKSDTTSSAGKSPHPYKEDSPAWLALDEQPNRNGRSGTRSLFLALLFEQLSDFCQQIQRISFFIDARVDVVSQFVDDSFHTPSPRVKSATL